MAAQPFYHSASVLFTTVDTSITRDEFTQMLQRAFVHLQLPALKGIIVDTLECEAIDSEAGDPADL